MLTSFIMALGLNMVLNWYDVIELLKQSQIRSSSWKNIRCFIIDVLGKFHVSVPS